uniref:winged helix-turn-helix domain-containing protein n=1 Tax=Streptomyces canus TaxID=58343 RepID=UPI0027D91B4A|nr:winged helix-turn-helix domain-containing protein [Streptomyces canus]
MPFVSALLGEARRVSQAGAGRAWMGGGPGGAAARVATLIGRKFHVSYSVSGATRLMHRLGFSCRSPCGDWQAAAALVTFALCGCGRRSPPAGARLVWPWRTAGRVLPDRWRAVNVSLLVALVRGWARWPRQTGYRRRGWSR